MFVSLSVSICAVNLYMSSILCVYKSLCAACMSTFRSVSLCVCQFVYVTLSWLMCPSVYVSMSTSMSLSVYLCLYDCHYLCCLSDFLCCLPVCLCMPFVSLPACLPACLHACLPACLPGWPSVHWLIKIKNEQILRQSSLRLILRSS